MKLSAMVAADPTKAGSSSARAVEIVFREIRWEGKIPGTVEWASCSKTRRRASLEATRPRQATSSLPTNRTASTSRVLRAPPTARQTIGAWKQAKFSAAQPQDPQISGDAADPDRDGVVNLLEYAFNLNPLIRDRDAVIQSGGSVPTAGRVSALVPAVQRNEDFFTVTYVRRKAPVDLKYWVELSTDLTNWISEEQSPTRFATVGQTDIGDGMVLETVTVRSTTPMTGPAAAPRQFFRVRVQSVP